MKKRKVKLSLLIFCLLLTYLVAFLGSIFTSMSTNSMWYKLVRPSITPPNFVFPIVWSILFSLMGLSLYFVWVNSKKKDKGNIIFVFGINYILNIVWSILYFGIRRPNIAFFEIILLWLSILGMVLFSHKIDKKAGWLLVPYLLWVGFASVLNYLSF